MATKLQDKIFSRYAYLARKYANKIFSYEELSFEMEDLVQEFSLKLVTSIKAYARKWARYRAGEEPKPVPIKAYLEAALGNKSRDFMNAISKENYKVRIDDINFDLGCESDSFIDYSEDQYVLNGVDLLEGLSGKERKTYIMYIKGYKGDRLALVYGGNGYNKFIKEHTQSLLTRHGGELLAAKQMYYSYSLGED